MLKTPHSSSCFPTPPPQQPCLCVGFFPWEHQKGRDLGWTICVFPGHSQLLSKCGFAKKLSRCLMKGGPSRPPLPRVPQFESPLFLWWELSNQAGLGGGGSGAWHLTLADLIPGKLLSGGQCASPRLCPPVHGLSPLRLLHSHFSSLLKLLRKGQGRYD